VTAETEKGNRMNYAIQKNSRRSVKAGIDVKALLLGLSMLVTGSALANEVTLCFEKAWAHPNDGGLGMPRGSAVDLCRGATDMYEVTQCYEKAWAHPDDGGLGMPRGLAVDLCRGASDMYKVTQCYEKAWAHPDNGGLGMPRGSAVDLCASTPRAK
jgi:hypothetical protein